MSDTEPLHSRYDRTDQLDTQVISGTTKQYVSDRFGNLVTAWDKASGSTTFTRDVASRLTGITPTGTGAITFGLDALDRHTTRTVAGIPPVTTDTYSYLDATETAWQAGAGSTATTSLLDVDGTRLAVKTNAGTVSWLVFEPYWV